MGVYFCTSFFIAIATPTATTLVTYLVVAPLNRFLAFPAVRGLVAATRGYIHAVVASSLPLPAPAPSLGAGPSEPQHRHAAATRRHGTAPAAAPPTPLSRPLSRPYLGLYLGLCPAHAPHQAQPLSTRSPAALPHIRWSAPSST